MYHRLSVYPVPIPPLRERGHDILLLAGRFLELNRARLGLRSLRLSADSESKLLHYQWPGNIRELEHVISRAALKAISRGAQRTDIVTLESALLDLDEPSMSHAVSAATAQVENSVGTVSLRDQVDNCQRQAIHQALTNSRNNWAEAARSLGTDASNLHKLARRLAVKN